MPDCCMLPPSKAFWDSIGSMQGLVSHRRQVQACSVHVYPVHARAAGKSNRSTG